MRESTRKEIREILEKLADGQPHSTDDLFPGLDEERVVEGCERVVGLCELGLVNGGFIPSGVGNRPRHVVDVRITPEGIRWLEHEQALCRFADRLFAKKAEQINEEHQKRHSEIKADFGKRGMVQSGRYFSALIRAALERVEALARARVDSVLEACEKAGVPLDRGIADHIADDAALQCATGSDSLVASLADSARRLNFNVSGLQDALRGEITRGSSRIVARIKRDLELKLDEAILQLPKTMPPVPQPGEGKSWDAFISYASEDEKEFVLPLAHRLTAAGVRVWCAPLTLKVGDSLRRSIDDGLARSRHGIVVLSPHFFAKAWPQRELDGLVAKEVGQDKVILPVWHGVSREFVVRFSPMLADRVAVNSADGLDTVVKKLLEVIRPAPASERLPE